MSARLGEFLIHGVRLSQRQLFSCPGCSMHDLNLEQLGHSLIKEPVTSTFEFYDLTSFALDTCEHGHDHNNGHDNNKP